MSDETARDAEVRRQALCRDIGRRLAISSIAEVEAIDQRLLELERARDERLVLDQAELALGAR